MSKEKFDEVSKRFWQKMADDNVQGIMRHKPFSDDYWGESPRVVVCNYEIVGFQDSQINDIPFDKFRDLIANTKSKTVRWTAVFTNALLKLLRKEEFSVAEMKKSFYKIDDLHQSMKNVMYMNLRPTSAKTNLMEKRAARQLIYKYKNDLKEFIEALDADIFILSSKDSVDLFNTIFDIKDNPLSFKKNKRLNNRLVFSVKHFGRGFSYKYYYNTAQEIAYIWYHNS
jgi:hypothetical protein